MIGGFRFIRVFDVIAGAGNAEGESSADAGAEGFAKVMCAGNGNAVEVGSFAEHDEFGGVNVISPALSTGVGSVVVIFKSVGAVVIADDRAAFITAADLSLDVAALYL